MKRGYVMQQHGNREGVSPAHPRAKCPDCGKKGLGNPRLSSTGSGRRFRDCRYCGASTEVPA